MMNTSKQFTPGPWRVGDAGHAVFGPKTDAVSPVTIATVRSAKDAAVLAAAPEMFEAGNALLNALITGDSVRINAARDAMRVALDKAQS